MKLDAEIVTKLMKTIYETANATKESLKNQHQDDFGTAAWCGADVCGANIADAVTKMLCAEIKKSLKSL